jgi:hypothetical protein
MIIGVGCLAVRASTRVVLCRRSDTDNPRIEQLYRFNDDGIIVVTTPAQQQVALAFTQKVCLAPQLDHLGRRGRLFRIHFARAVKMGNSGQRESNPHFGLCPWATR